MEIIDKKEFAAVALNADDKSFLLYIAALAKPMTMPIYSSCQAKVALLTSEETRISTEYSDFSNVFSLDSAVELLEHTKINDHPLNPLDNKQPPYSLIYSLELIELETLKTYIKVILANSFIRLFKFLTNAPILFVQKKDGSFCLYVNNQELNNLTMKNRYPLPLISKLLDCLGYAKHFTHLNLTNAYYQMRIRDNDK